MPAPRRTPDLSLLAYADGAGNIFGVHVLKRHGNLHLSGKIMKGQPGDWLVCTAASAFIIPPEAGAALLSRDNTEDATVVGYEDAVYFV